MDAAPLVHLPQEIFYQIAKSMDLTSFGPLLLSCKETLARLGTDLQLQKLVFENTTRKLMHEKLKMPIRTIFIERLTLMALKSNDIEIMKFALPNMSFRSILQKIKPMRDKMGVSPVKRQHFLAEVFKHDADKVLKHMIDICFNELENDKSNGLKHIFGILSILGEYAIIENPSDDATSSKSLRYVLGQFKKFEKEVLISFIYVSAIDNSYWGLSETPTLDFFKCLLIRQQEFPEKEFAFNFDQGIPESLFREKIERKMPNPNANNVNNGYTLTQVPPGRKREALITPLEFAVYCGSQKALDLMLEHGATFDPKLPYLAIAFHRWTCTQEALVHHLTELGADINRPLPQFLDRLQRDILRYFMQEQNQDNIIVIEMLLHHGAKTFVTENELEQLKNDTAPDTALTLLALKAQMNGPYKTLQPTQLTFPYGPTSSRLFKTSRFSTKLQLFANGEFRLNNGEQIGTWVQVEGKIICSGKKREFTYWSRRGSGGSSYTEVIEITPTALTYIIFTIFTGEVALTEDDPTTSIDRKLAYMLWHDERTMYYHG